MYPDIPSICNPFSGPPDYQYRTELCPENTVRIGDIPKVWPFFLNDVNQTFLFLKICV